MDLAFKVAVLCFVAWIAWQILQPRYAFVIRIGNSTPRLVKGKVTDAFLLQVKEACLSCGVVQGVVRGIVRGGRISLAFSRNIPPQCQQQIRNLWAMSGWTPARGQP